MGDARGRIGEFGTVNALATYTDGGNNTFVYVADSGNNRIQKFDADGGPLAQWGTAGSAAGEISEINGITTDSAGNVWTLEGRNRRVQKFTASGGPILEFEVSPPAVCGTAGIDVDASFFYVACGHGKVIERYSASTGALVDSAGSASTCWGSACTPRGDLRGRLERRVRLRRGLCGLPGAVSPIIFGGAEGVTINDGAQYSNDAAVQLKVVAPGAATEVRVSNDGGFASPATMPLAAGGLYSWTLDSSGSERLPKTVYVRFANPTTASAQTFTDDIILDQTPPTISQATLLGEGTGSSAAAVAAAKRKFTVRLRARDNASGVGKAQVARRKKRPGRLRKFRKRLTVKSARAPRFVRVRDKAGNFSKWRHIKRPKR